MIVLPLLKDLFNEALRSEKRKQGRLPGQKANKSRLTGFAHVTIVKCDKCSQGFVYQYYSANKYRSRRKTTSVDIKVLHDRVVDKGWDWYIDDKNLAQETLRKNKVPYALIDLL